ncbi:glutathione S-transferase T3-like [Oryza brachyantha]|uniref:No apical meristem-associated C-terminal domain-containing protein n=1 Tax=Oryza brachyantha TaxID=4533 RepID=J3NCI0_ORYBR|nr:glutathione S-transferase T3-like [Oryza brachyantha]
MQEGEILKLEFLSPHAILQLPSPRSRPCLASSQSLAIDLAPLVVAGESMDSNVGLLGSDIHITNRDPCQFDRPTGEKAKPIAKVGGSSRPNNRRSKNFSTAEDRMLVSAWLNTSMDLVTRTEQQSDSYWARIHQYFHQQKDFISDRNQNSLNNRWGSIKELVNKFCEHYEQILNRRKSGMTAEDHIAQACAAYKLAEGKHFSLIHCWHLLHRQPKWDSRFSQKKQKTHVDASPSTNSSKFKYNPETSNPTVRPLVKKAEKEKRGQDISSSCTSESSHVVVALNNMWSEKKVISPQAREERNDTYTQVLTLERERLQIEKKRVELEMREREERIMNMDLSVLDGPKKQYYMHLQNEILSRGMD